MQYENICEPVPGKQSALPASRSSAPACKSTPTICISASFAPSPCSWTSLIYPGLIANFVIPSGLRTN